MTSQAASTVRQYGQGQVIIREGQAVDHAYVVKSGQVVVYRVLNNRRVILARLTPGQIVGEMGALTDRPASATVEAEEQSEVALIDRSALETLLERTPKPIRLVMDLLIGRLQHMDASVEGRPPANLFLGVCQALELLHKALPADSAQPPGVRITDIYRTSKRLYLVSQLEVDDILERLRKVAVVAIHDVKNTRYEKDALGRSRKADVFVSDRFVTISDPVSFPEVTRHLADEMAKSDKLPGAQAMEFIDILDFAAQVEAEAEMIYKKIGNREFPERLLFLPRAAALQWSKEMGPDFFKKTRRKRLNLDELESVDDLVFVDNATLQEALSKVGFHNVAVLLAGAGDEAREKLLANMSSKMAAIIQSEAADMAADEAELADVECGIIEAVRELKAGK